MSWQAYVDSSLEGSGHVRKGAIISVAGDSVWAQNKDFTLKPEEMKAIASIVGGDEGAKDKAFGEGIYVAGDRFVIARADGGSLYARQGRNGVAVAKTNQCIIIGFHDQDQVAGNTTSTVESLADYLSGQGY